MEPVKLALSLFSFVDNIDTLSAALFVIGLLLLAAEMFVPGFGIIGGAGLIMVVIGIVLTAETVLEAVVMVVILLLLVALAVFFVLRSAKKGKLSKKLVLWSSARRENGFTSNTDNSAMVGKEGVAITILRPAGTGEFDGQRLDVVTEGAFLEQGSRILIIRTEGRRIIVRPVQ